MSEIKVVLKDKGLMEQLKSLDKRDEMGDEDNFWLEFNMRPEEITFSDGTLNFSFSSDELPSVFIEMPIEELLEQFDRFGIVDDIQEYMFKNHQRTAKIIKLVNQIKNIRDAEQEEWLKKYREANPKRKYIKSAKRRKTSNRKIKR